MGIRVMFLQNPREVAAAQAAQARAEARDAAQQARDAAEQARDVARAKRDAAQAEREAREIGGSGDNTTIVTVTKDGTTMTLKDASPQAIATALGMPDPYDRGENTAWMAIPVTGIMMTAIVILTSMVLRYRTRMRGAGPAAALPSDLVDRLARMEAGIESTAIEVERISEGQRFTTRLLSERPVMAEVPRV